MAINKNFLFCFLDILRSNDA